MDPRHIPTVVRDKLLIPYGVRGFKRAMGGLSSALTWSCQSIQGETCLRAWPEGGITPERLHFIHAALLQARSEGIEIVPQVHTADSGSTFIEAAGRLWELTQWMPGTADYLQQPSDLRLRSAMSALAQLHRVWATHTIAQPSPAVASRVELLKMWLCAPPVRFDGSGLASKDTWENQLAAETLGALTRWGPSLLAQLQELAPERSETHFVLRDIWSDHVLFTGDQVTGIIDFGAARVDEPATDVARLLGSLEPSDSGRWSLGLELYKDASGVVDQRRVELLDRASTLLSAAQWLRWLLVEQREFPVPKPYLYRRWQQHLSRTLLLFDSGLAESAGR